MSSPNFGPKPTEPSGQSPTSPTASTPRPSYDDNASGYHVGDSTNDRLNADGLYGEQYDWASFLPYTVKLGEGQWNTWMLISVGVYILNWFVVWISVALSNLLIIVMFATAILAVVQIYQARQAYKETGSTTDIKLVVPRGWVLSIISLAFSALMVLDLISRLFI